MSSHSLALMFAPNLIWTSSQSTLSGVELDRFSTVLHYMIQNCYEVFEVQFIYVLYTESWKRTVHVKYMNIILCVYIHMGCIVL